MGNRADEEGTDVEIYRKPLSDTVQVDTPTGAPERLLALLDSLGFERTTVETNGPVYVWHEVPGHLGEDEKKQLVSRALPPLLSAGCLVNLPADLFDPVVYQDAVAEAKRRSRSSAPVHGGPPHPAPRPADGRTAPRRR
ncbi:hypothetical protein [Streptomyces sp. NPDC003077]|uniref:hypothetical protein n=1 Tax=Streptomyces sp. NPDC003077 TaxID=3154443 RepID=UPI0033A17D75